MYNVVCYEPVDIAECERIKAQADRGFAIVNVT